MINSILLVPGAGHMGDGQYSRGVTTPQLCEVELVDSYLVTLVECLEEFNLRHFVLDTRKPPGVSENSRLRENEPHTLRIELTMGQFIAGSCGKPRSRNESLVEYSGYRAYPIAKMICNYLAIWGQNSSFGHCTRNPIMNVELAEGCIRIKPFMINGVDAHVYASRCAVLGRELGLALFETLSPSKEALRGSPAMV